MRHNWKPHYIRKDSKDYAGKKVNKCTVCGCIKRSVRGVGLRFVRTEYTVNNVTTNRVPKCEEKESE